MAVTYFTSSDSGAPTLNGVAGTGTTTLDWVLNTKGGWAIEYTGTNKRIYRAGSGNRFRLRVVDDGSASGNAYNLVARGAESASTVDTLTDPFPTVAQRSDANCCWIKSSAASSTARAYKGIVTDTFLVMLVRYDGTNWEMWTFGDVPSRYPGDAYATLIAIQAASASGNVAGQFVRASGSSALSSTCGFMTRNANGTTKSVCAGIVGVTNGTNYGVGGGPVFDPSTNKVLLMKCPLYSSGEGSTGALNASTTETARAWLPYMWMPQHSGYSGIADGDVMQDNAYNASASFILQKTNSTGYFVLETTATWSAP